MAEHCGTSAPISIPLATCTKRRELGTYTVECLATVKNCFVNVTPVVTWNLCGKKTKKDVDYHVTFSINIAYILYIIRIAYVVRIIVLIGRQFCAIFENAYNIANNSILLQTLRKNLVVCYVSWKMDKSEFL